MYKKIKLNWNTKISDLTILWKNKSRYYINYQGPRNLVKVSLQLSLLLLKMCAIKWHYWHCEWPNLTLEHSHLLSNGSWAEFYQTEHLTLNASLLCKHGKINANVQMQFHITVSACVAADPRLLVERTKQFGKGDNPTLKNTVCLCAHVKNDGWAKISTLKLELVTKGPSTQTEITHQRSLHPKWNWSPKISQLKLELVTIDPSSQPQTEIRNQRSFHPKNWWPLNANREFLTFTSDLANVNP